MPLTLNNKLRKLKIGDYFWCKYTAITGVVGTFSDMGKKTDNEVSSNLLPSTATTTPNGYFKWIVVDIKNGKTICIADRRLHNNMSFDIINNDGYVFGRQTMIDNNNESNIKYTLKLMTGGYTSSDTNNDYDKYIVNSTLNGKISAGDTNVWNHVTGHGDLTSSTPVANTSRVIRGTTNLNTYSTVASSSSAVGYNYRPMLIIEKSYINKSFILTNGEYKKVRTTTTITSYTSSNSIATPIMTSQTSPSGKAFHSTSYSATYDAWKLFNQADESEGWCTPSGTVVGIAGYIFDSPKAINKYVIRSQNVNLNSTPKNWTFEGSNDTTTGLDGTWVILDTQTNQSMLSQVSYTDYTYTIQNSNLYKSYRINITANNGNASIVGFGEFKLYESIPILTSKNELITVSTVLPVKSVFVSDGISDLSIFDRKITKLEQIDMGTSVNLGNGKQFRKSIDLKKYFDVRNISIK